MPIWLRLKALLTRMVSSNREAGSDEWIAKRDLAQTLVVFVHGIGGHSTLSWGKFPTLIAKDPDLGNVDVYCWSYPSGLILRTPSIGMTARQLFTELKLRFGGYSRIVLVGHSLGGLVIRAMVLQALKEAQARSLDNIDHIFTFGTPNDGSELAMVANLLGIANSQMKSLDFSGEDVARLRNEWINLVYAPKIAPGEELIKRRIPLTTVAGLEDNVVPPSSVLSYFADPVAEVVPGGHLSMKEPSGEQSSCYLLVKRVLLRTPSTRADAARLASSILNETDLSPQEWLCVALLEDQFASGVWGGSLESTGDLYGKGQDVGSISVSVKCCQALDSATRSSQCESISRFRDYLLQHRSERGAFGMLRTVGSSAFPVVEIIENCRHTAAAVTFFQRFDGLEHPYLASAVRFLLDKKSQTPSGLWVDVGPRDEERVDPLTVSQVVASLEDVLVASGTAHLDEELLNESIERGLDYLFLRAYRTDEGYWLYRFSNESERKRQLANVYRYSAGVLSCITKAAVRRKRYAEEVIRLATSLGAICARYRGLPDSPSSARAGLSATINLYSCCSQIAELSQLAGSLAEYASELARSSGAWAAGNASGWASALDFLADVRHPVDLLKCENFASRLRELGGESGSTGGAVDVLRSITERRRRLETAMQ